MKVPRILNFPEGVFIKSRRATTRCAFSLALVVQLCVSSRLRGEDHVDYRYENYQEEHGRIAVQTHAVLFDAVLKEGLLSVKGELVHDAVSGATPNGAAPPSKYNYDFGFPVTILGNTNSTEVPLAHMEDERKALSIEAPVTLGRHEITPQFAYSEESDYISTGAALNYSLQLNEKNTTLNLGWAATWDRVRDDQRRWQNKEGDDFLLGVVQLLGPESVLGVNLTWGRANGYLNDPYRFIVGATDPQLDADNPAGAPEQRPRNRDKMTARVSLTRFVTPANASIEGAYRFYHDTYGINAHTIELTWYQKIGKHVVLAPNARYYWQSAANFYYEILPGSIFSPPDYYSPDYRLSEFQSYTFGLSLTVTATEWLMFDAAYKRYVMEGLDGVTSQSAYPRANVFTVGARLLF